MTDTMTKFFENEQYLLDMSAASEEVFKETVDIYEFSRGCKATWFTPAEGPDYQILGYDEYLVCMIKAVADVIVEMYGGEVTPELLKEVADNLTDIADDIMSVFEFERKGAEHFYDMEQDW